MVFIGLNEAQYLKKHLAEVKHVTLNPNGSDVLRIHMIPPKRRFNKDVPCAVVVNGQDIVPLNLSWAILLSAFMDAIAPYDGKGMQPGDWESIVAETIRSVNTVYRGVKEDRLRDDLWTIISTLADISQGKKPQADIGQISIGEYAKHMKAPHRMDLMISSMTRGESWNCNQKCLHCYAAGQTLASAQELSTREWTRIIDRCREAGIPQITFTGGEPTLRGDLAELVDHSKWFITRLNTNGVLLTKDLCARLHEASLDSVQITLYAAEAEAHNALVGADNWDKTVAGIQNALEASLSVSVNTPLCALNRDYLKTLGFVRGLGVRYLTCSGLIIAGSAKSAESTGTQLSAEALETILGDAYRYCAANGMELSFTSPGWVPENRLRDIGFTSIPTCGACLSNMAVSPDGRVVPCQSWLSADALGSMLTDPWEKIWDSPACRKIREESARMAHRCPLRVQPEVNS